MGKRWYLAAMNDGLFIIDAPPRPSTDDAFNERDVNAIAYVGYSAQDEAMAHQIIDAHNASLEER